MNESTKRLNVVRSLRSISSRNIATFSIAQSPSYALMPGSGGGSPLTRHGVSDLLAVACGLVSRLRGCLALLDEPFKVRQEGGEGGRERHPKRLQVTVSLSRLNVAESGRHGIAHSLKLLGCHLGSLDSSNLRCGPLTALVTHGRGHVARLDGKRQVRLHDLPCASGGLVPAELSRKVVIEVGVPALAVCRLVQLPQVVMVDDVEGACDALNDSLHLAEVFADILLMLAERVSGVDDLATHSLCRLNRRGEGFQSHSLCPFVADCLPARLRDLAQSRQVIPDMYHYRVSHLHCQVSCDF